MDRDAAAKKAYVENYPQRVAASKRAYRERNAEKLREKHRIYNADKREEINKKTSQYKKENPHKHTALQRKRRAIQCNALPSWADLAAIESFYIEAATLTRTTGIAYHVDHIVPLQGKNVCGLHTQENLRVITALDNMIKGNR